MRDAGLASRGLLGGLSKIIWATSKPSVRHPRYGRSRSRSTQGRRLCCSEAGATKPGEYGRMGAGQTSNGGLSVQEFTAV